MKTQIKNKQTNNAETHLESSQISVMESFCENSSALGCYFHSTYIPPDIYFHTKFECLQPDVYINIRHKNLP